MSEGIRVMCHLVLHTSFNTAHWYSPLNSIVGYVRLTEFGEIDKREDGDFK
jgi:hypothetical protein